MFVGDSGQADALTAQLLTNGLMAEGTSRPLTTFIHDLRESSDDLRAVSPAFRRLSTDDLVGDPPAARRGVIVFRNYIHAATIAYLQRDTLINLIDANELAAIASAALADFERVAATAPSRKTLESQYKADAERATALVAASGWRLPPPRTSAGRSTALSGKRSWTGHYCHRSVSTGSMRVARSVGPTAATATRWR